MARDTVTIRPAPPGVTTDLRHLGSIGGYDYAVIHKSDRRPVIAQRPTLWQGAPLCGWRFHATVGYWNDIGADQYGLPHA